METTISWNATNMVTIWLMAAIGFAVIGFAAQAYKKSKVG
jgi:hypothetical protein